MVGFYSGLNVLDGLFGGIVLKIQFLHFHVNLKFYILESKSKNDL